MVAGRQQGFDHALPGRPNGAFWGHFEEMFH
jgi:hypothetical protein